MRQHSGIGVLDKAVGVLRAVAWKETPLGSLTLVGKIDRVDYAADGS
ncbi:MAG: hypothetical protein H7Y15_18780, partial [Pseudonocardia sp.]|nr:hypothetical protein [Pseudonocardia sp.]